LALDGSYYVDTGEPLATEVPSVDPESEERLARIAGLDDFPDDVDQDNVEEAPDDVDQDNVKEEAPDQKSLGGIFTEEVRTEARRLFKEQMTLNSSEDYDDSTQ
jgi:hypothetical protein